MPDKFENPNFTVSQENLELVNRKEREARSVGGMTSSWTAAPDPALVPPDKMKLILESQAAHQKQVEKEREIQARNPLPLPGERACLVTIPKQAMKPFMRLLPLFEAVQVNLTSAQRKMFLESLQTLKTPSNLMDAKAIFNLMDILRQ